LVAGSVWRTKSKLPWRKLSVFFVRFSCAASPSATHLLASKKWSHLTFSRLNPKFLDETEKHPTRLNPRLKIMKGSLAPLRFPALNPRLKDEKTYPTHSFLLKKYWKELAPYVFNLNPKFWVRQKHLPSSPYFRLKIMKGNALGTT
jgi:hypothetical protein